MLPSQEVAQELFTLTSSSMTQCLTDLGGTLTAGDVATFPDGVDQIAVCDECVAEVKAIVAQRVAELT